MTAAHASLYRKYRPQTFAEVRDQDHIIRVLEGALRKGEIPHALLFCGTRGTGKTTTARLFARALGTTDLDLYEIDAASNRGIDDVRELREAVHTVPYESRYKVYIIDEVHMLTKEAFNALLKTLEEPPAHVVFILATTEEDKLLDTIKSRCQVFRFRSPSRAVLSEAVTDVARKEGFALAPDAADLIAIAADGSFRDALGITQKVILASGDTIGSADEVAAIIGAPRVALLTRLLIALDTLDTAGALSTIADATAAHVDMGMFVRLFLEQLRAVLLLRHVPTEETTILAAFGEAARATITTIAKRGAASPLNSHMLLHFLAAAEQLARSPLPALPLEIAIIEVTTKEVK
jgi:DNA polymerase-3 subunit gamma/tau